MLKNKRAKAIFIAILFALSIFNVRICAEDYKISVDSVTADGTGFCEVIGHISGASENTQVACLVVRDAAYDGEEVISKNLTFDNIAWIDQVGTGENGTFLIQFNVREDFEKTTLTVLLGSELTEMSASVIEIPDLPPPGIEVIANNSVIYGCDAFLITGAFYTPDKIAESIGYGGNNIYFKIGDKWYDLMDESAIDNSFLTEENATPNEEIEAAKPRYYYSLEQEIELKYR